MQNDSKFFYCFTFNVCKLGNDSLNKPGKFNVNNKLDTAQAVQYKSATLFYPNTI